MDLSSTKKQEAKKLGVTVQELVMSDLLSIGYGEVDAYIIAYPEDRTLSFSMQQSNRKKIMSRHTFVELCDKRKITNANILHFSGNTSDVELIDNEMTAKEILKIAKQMPDGSKERGEMFMKYADLTRKNDAVTEEAMDAIQFYFPVKCNQCPLFDAYNTFRKNHKDREVRPVEMDDIIRNTHPIIEKAKKKAGI